MSRLCREGKGGDGRGKQGEGRRCCWGGSRKPCEATSPQGDRKALEEAARGLSLDSHSRFAALRRLKGAQTNRQQQQQHVVWLSGKQSPGGGGGCCCCCFARRGSRTLQWVGGSRGSRTAAGVPGLVTKEPEGRRMATSSNSSLSGSSVSSGKFASDWFPLCFIFPLLMAGAHTSPMSSHASRQSEVQHNLWVGILVSAALRATMPAIASSQFKLFSHKRPPLGNLHLYAESLDSTLHGKEEVECMLFWGGGRCLSLSAVQMPWY